MKLISVNVSPPKEIQYKGESVTTGIFKEPVQGRVMLRELNLDGDGQADLTVHGGVHQAVYVYPLEHYDYWKHKLGRQDLPYGQFGENFTVAEMMEDQVHIGDIFRIGSAVVQITQPRVPCYK
ncbi:MAG: MOSC domain-containing protein, partial [bacterium]